MSERFDESLGSTPSTQSGAATPDSRERPALIGDLCDADIASLRELAAILDAIGNAFAGAERFRDIATRYEIILGAYSTALRNGKHEVGNE